MYHYDFSVKIMKGKETVEGEIGEQTGLKDFFSHQEIL